MSRYIDGGRRTTTTCSNFRSIKMSSQYEKHYLNRPDYSRVQKLILSAALLLICSSLFGNAHCATFDIGSYPGSTSSISDGTVASNNIPAMLPSSGTFTDDYLFSVNPTGGGSLYANISWNGVSVSNITGLNAQIVSFLPLSNVPLPITGYELLAGTATSIPTGGYDLRVSGTITGAVANYSGNLSISPITATPVPAAVWLFGSALVGIFGVSRRRV